MAGIFQVGDVTSRIITFDVDSVKQFATLAGDMSPLHHDEALATSTKFGGLIVSGTHYSAIMMGMVATFLTEARAGLGLEFNFKFCKAIKVNDTVKIEWKIISIEPSTKLGGELIILEGKIVNKEGETCVIGKSTSLSMPFESLLPRK